MIYEVSLPVPLNTNFEYIGRDNFPNGARVIVPFGKRKLCGIIQKNKTTSDYPIEKLKSIEKCLDDKTIINISLEKLINFTAKYYHYPLGKVYETALPKYVRDGREILEPEIEKNQKTIYENIPDFLLTAEQEKIIEDIAVDLNTYKAQILFGETGSGKTEIYLQLISRIIKQNLQVIVLLPEINLTPQTKERFQERFSCEVAILNSSISDKKKLMYWSGAKSGKYRIILGTRSAIFTPLQSPGLYIVDEEHDQSYVQQDKLRYSARDLAIYRAKQDNCNVVLGSATIMLETYFRALKNEFNIHYLYRRDDLIPVNIKTVDLNDNEYDISPKVIETAKKFIKDKKQVMFFINRRGYAPLISCKCGWQSTCIQCDSNLVLYVSENIMKCQHCNSSYKIPRNCQKCGDSDISSFGIGTEQVEEILKKKFFDKSIIRLDRDTITTQKKLEEALNKINQRDVDIIIGTQMLAKGHHFEHLAYVAILNIDQSLFSADFRAIEKMGQLITQIAGRPGRSGQSSIVHIQTKNPQHIFFTERYYNDYIKFLEYILNIRKELQLPPFSHQALIRSSNKNKNIALSYLNDMKSKLKFHNCLALGPILAPVARKKGVYQAQLLLQSRYRKDLHNSVFDIESFISKIKQKNDISIDIDPADMY